MRTRTKNTFDDNATTGVLTDEDEEEVEHVQIAQVAIATVGVMRPVRASQLSARKVFTSAATIDNGSPQRSPNGSVSDLQSRSSRSPQPSDGSRPPSSLSNTRMTRSGSTESYTTAGSQPNMVTRSSFSNAPPRIHADNVSTFADLDMTTSPLETSSSGHSSMRFRSPSLTVATSSLGHGSHAVKVNRAIPSPSLSVRDSVSPDVPPKDGGWRTRSPALSVSASESGDGAHSPSGPQQGWRNGKKGPSSLDNGHGLGHQTQDSWASTTHSIASSDGNHSSTRGTGLRDRRQAPPRIYPPSTSTRWAHINQHDDGSGRRPSHSGASPSSMQMQRQTSGDSLTRADRSPMSDHSHGSASFDYKNQQQQQRSSRQQPQQQHYSDRASIRSAQSDGDSAYLAAHDRRQQSFSHTTSPISADGRSPHSGFHSPASTHSSIQDRDRGSVSTVASSRDSMGPPPPPPPKLRWWCEQAQNTSFLAQTASSACLRVPDLVDGDLAAALWLHFNKIAFVRHPCRPPCHLLLRLRRRRLPTIKPPLKSGSTTTRTDPLPAPLFRRLRQACRVTAAIRLCRRYQQKMMNPMITSARHTIYDHPKALRSRQSVLLRWDRHGLVLRMHHDSLHQTSSPQRRSEDFGWALYLPDSNSTRSWEVLLALTLASRLPLLASQSRCWTTKLTPLVRSRLTRRESRRKHFQAALQRARGPAVATASAGVLRSKIATTRDLSSRSDLGHTKMLGASPSRCITRVALTRLRCSVMTPKR